MRETLAHMIYMIPAIFLLSLVILGLGGLLIDPNLLHDIWVILTNNGGVTY